MSRIGNTATSKVIWLKSPWLPFSLSLLLVPFPLETISATDVVDIVVIVVYVAVGFPNINLKKLIYGSSVVGLDQHWFDSWIRIRVRAQGYFPKFTKIIMISSLSKRLLYLRRYVLWPITCIKYIFHVKIQLLVTAKSDQNPYWFDSLDPDPHWGKKLYTYPQWGKKLYGSESDTAWKPMRIHNTGWKEACLKL